MIDFYLYSDDLPWSRNKKIDSKFAGQLEEETFFSLQNKGVIDSRFDPYKDIRWTNEIIKQIQVRANQLASDPDIKILNAILSIAFQNSSGLIGIGE